MENDSEDKSVAGRVTRSRRKRLESEIDASTKMDAILENTPTKRITRRQSVTNETSAGTPSRITRRQSVTNETNAGTPSRITRRQSITKTPSKNVVAETSDGTPSRTTTRRRSISAAIANKISHFNTLSEEAELKDKKANATKVSESQVDNEKVEEHKKHSSSKDKLEKIENNSSEDEVIEILDTDEQETMDGNTSENEKQTLHEESERKQEVILPKSDNNSSLNNPVAEPSKQVFSVAFEPDKSEPSNVAKKVYQKTPAVLNKKTVMSSSKLFNSKRKISMELDDSVVIVGIQEESVDDSVSSPGNNLRSSKKFDEFTHIFSKTILLDSFNETKNVNHAKEDSTQNVAANEETVEHIGSSAVEQSSTSSKYQHDLITEESANDRETQKLVLSDSPLKDNPTQSTLKTVFPLNDPKPLSLEDNTKPNSTFDELKKKATAKTVLIKENCLPQIICSNDNMTFKESVATGRSQESCYKDSIETVGTENIKITRTTKMTADLLSTSLKSQENEESLTAEHTKDEISEQLVLGDSPLKENSIPSTIQTALPLTDLKPLSLQNNTNFNSASNELKKEDLSKAVKKMKDNLLCTITKADSSPKRKDLQNEKVAALKTINTSSLPLIDSPRTRAKKTTETVESQQLNAPMIAKVANNKALAVNKTNVEMKGNALVDAVPLSKSDLVKAPKVKELHDDKAVASNTLIDSPKKRSKKTAENMEPPQVYASMIAKDSNEKALIENKSAVDMEVDALVDAVPLRKSDLVKAPKVKELHDDKAVTSNTLIDSPKKRSKKTAENIEPPQVYASMIAKDSNEKALVENKSAVDMEVDVVAEAVPLSKNDLVKELHDDKAETSKTMKTSSFAIIDSPRARLKTAETVELLQLNLSMTASDSNDKALTENKSAVDMEVDVAVEAVPLSKSDLVKSPQIKEPHGNKVETSKTTNTSSFTLIDSPRTRSKHTTDALEPLQRNAIMSDKDLNENAFAESKSAAEMKDKTVSLNTSVSAKVPKNSSPSKGPSSNQEPTSPPYRQADSNKDPKYLQLNESAVTEASKPESLFNSSIVMTSLEVAPSVTCQENHFEKSANDTVNAGSLPTKDNRVSAERTLVTLSRDEFLHKSENYAHMEEMNRNVSTATLPKSLDLHVEKTEAMHTVENDDISKKVDILSVIKISPKKNEPCSKDIMNEKDTDDQVSSFGAIDKNCNSLKIEETLTPKNSSKQILSSAKKQGSDASVTTTSELKEKTTSSVDENDKNLKEGEQINKVIAPLTTESPTSSQEVSSTYSKSWMPSVRSNTKQIDSIKALSETTPKVANEQKCTKQSKREIVESSPEYEMYIETEEEYEVEEEEEAEDRDNSFLDNQCIDAGIDYESGDSMNSEERALYAENLFEDEHGESIGSEDTYEGEEDEYENDSFIAPSDEEPNDDDDESPKFSDQEVLLDEKPKKYKRLAVMSSDSEEDEVVEQVEQQPSVNALESNENEVQVEQTSSQIDEKKIEFNEQTTENSETIFRKTANELISEILPKCDEEPTSTVDENDDYEKQSADVVVMQMPISNNVQNSYASDNSKIYSGQHLLSNASDANAVEKDERSTQSPEELTSVKETTVEQSHGNTELQTEKEKTNESINECNEANSSVSSPSFSTDDNSSMENELRDLIEATAFEGRKLKRNVNHSIQLPTTLQKKVSQPKRQSLLRSKDSEDGLSRSFVDCLNKQKLKTRKRKLSQTFEGETQTKKKAKHDVTIQDDDDETTPVKIIKPKGIAHILQRCDDILDEYTLRKMSAKKQGKAMKNKYVLIPSDGSQSETSDANSADKSVHISSDGSQSETSDAHSAEKSKKAAALKRCFEAADKILSSKNPRKQRTTTTIDHTKIKIVTQDLEVNYEPDMNAEEQKNAAIKRALLASRKILTSNPSKMNQKAKVNNNKAPSHTEKLKSKKLSEDFLEALVPKSQGNQRKRKRVADDADHDIKVFETKTGIVTETKIHSPLPKVKKHIEVLKMKTGTVFVDLASPVRVKRSRWGFEESPASPINSGWKVDEIRNKKRRCIENKAGVFKVEKIPKVEIAASIQEQAPDIAKRARDFLKTSLNRDNMQREDLRNVLKRKRLL